MNQSRLFTTYIKTLVAALEFVRPTKLADVVIAVIAFYDTAIAYIHVIFVCTRFFVATSPGTHWTCIAPTVLTTRDARVTHGSIAIDTYIF